ncbi:tRNA-dihydrouridine(20) synthase [NAD(P)+]-like [Schistocerca gregaria]|uniref:tRNA-dihydrouridine(20) synthase [NAD(P)+]-like n=1 Tax=Schistocerca gregaria TaxID=7010 RepID=UPI00211EE588|nr:tRNA-dihydrouridine(20) synthase [NAD(P)+]-like [Schistocerca gregaria]
MRSEIDYKNKVILAPMVRVGTLAFRLLALKYGADIVYSEELIDKKLIQCQRTVNSELGTIDYVCKRENKCIWRTCKDDHPTVIQLGTASDRYAVEAALNMYPDYDAIDVNMGCPERFSLQGGMGAALLKDRERVKLILGGLLRHIDKPVTCKIRLLNKIEDTVDLVKTIEATGAAAIAVHARYVEQRPREPAFPSLVKILSESVHIPLIFNGDIRKFEDINKAKETAGCSSVMIGRGALINCSIFSEQSPRPQKEVCMDYIRNCIQYENGYPLSKYTVLKMFGENKTLTKEPFYKHLHASKSHEQMLYTLEEEVRINGPGHFEWGNFSSAFH